MYKLASKQKFTNVCKQRHYQIGFIVNLFTLYVINHNGIIQRPHDHSLETSGHLGAITKAKIDKFEFILLKPNTLPGKLCMSICSHYTYFIILVSHKGLATVYFKSSGIWVQIGGFKK